MRDHKRIIFNGNGYDEKWIKEATEKRGLLNLRTTPDALPAVLNKKNVDLLTSHDVMSLAEIKSRYEITLENYCKTVNIEGLTMIDMARKEILPAVESYVKDLSETLVAKTAVLPTVSAKYERTLIEKLSVIVEEIDDAANSLESSLIEYKTITDVTKSAALIRDVILQKWRNSALSQTRRRRSPQKNTGRSRRTTNFCSAYNSKPQTVNTHRIKSVRTDAFRLFFQRSKVFFRRLVVFCNLFYCKNTQYFDVFRGGEHIVRNDGRNFVTRLFQNFQVFDKRF